MREPGAAPSDALVCERATSASTAAMVALSAPHSRSVRSASSSRKAMSAGSTSVGFFSASSCRLMRVKHWL